MDSDRDDHDERHDEIEPQIALLIPFFYRSSRHMHKPRDSAAAAARIVKALQAKPVMAYSISTNLPAFLLYVASLHPAHTDHILSTIKHLLEAPSLPPINGCHWDTSRPNVPFSEMFRIVFKDDLNSTVSWPFGISDPASYIAGSLVCARAMSLDMIRTPEIFGSLSEGLKLTSPPHSSVLNYEGEQAEIALVGSCLQLLASASSLMQHEPWGFTREIILAALEESARSDRNDPLIRFTISHIQKDPVTDLTSREIVDGLKAVGWRFPSDST